MEQNRIKPEKITKPIQLLAVWFSGLIILEGLLLTAARTIESPLWITPLLSVTAVGIIPLFLFFIFLLQTKYRPQMQEDTFYSKYLDKSTQRLLIAKKENTYLDEDLIQKSVENYFKHYKIEEISKKSIDIHPDLGNKDIIIPNVYKDKVALNRLLPNFQGIRLLLIKEKINNFDEFTPGMNNPPKELLITVGIEVNINLIIKIIELLRPIGFTLINSTIDEDLMLQDASKHEIIVGSYALNREERRTLEIDDELIETIKNIEDKTIFHKIFKK